MSKKMNEDIFDFLLAHALEAQSEDELAAGERDDAPVQFSDGFLRTFKRLIAKRKRQRILRNTPTYAKRFLVAMLTLATLLSCALFSDASVRASAADAFIRWREHFLIYDFLDDKPPEGFDGGMVAVAEYIPEGYSLYESMAYPLGDYMQSTLAYSNGHDITAERRDMLEIGVAPAYGTTYSCDNEHHIQEKMTVAGARDILFLRSVEEERPSFLLFVKDNYFFNITAPYSMTPETIQALAEGLRCYPPDDPRVKVYFNIDIGYIPEGYMYDHMEYNAGSSRRHTYKSLDDRTLRIQYDYTSRYDRMAAVYYDDSGSVIAPVVDMEHCAPAELELPFEREHVLYWKAQSEGYSSHLEWTIADHTFLLTVPGTMPEAEMLKIAANIAASY